MNAVDKAEALASIRQDLGGLGLGLVLGAVACYFVRPKTKATNALQMAQRWLAWGLLGSVSSGISFWMRNYEKGGIVGGLITIVFFSVLAWGLGYAWGLIKFPAAATTGTIKDGNASGPHSGAIVVAVAGVVILGLVALSALKKTPSDSDKELAEYNRILEDAGVGPVELPDLDTSAAQGNAFAQLQIGRDYLNGEGGKAKDPRKAFEWTRKAAEQGLPEAQGLLGVCYGEGTGVKKDEEEARKWTLKAAEQGHATAQALIGLDYYAEADTVKMSLASTSTDVNLATSQEKDKKAAYWLRKAAEQGDAFSQWLLGRLYQKGRGVEMDDEEAFRWLMMAAKQGKVEAERAVAVAYARGQGIEKAPKAAVEWNTRAARQGNARAQIALGFAYATGSGVIKDTRQALAWLYVGMSNSDRLPEETRGPIQQTVAEIEKELGTEQVLLAQEVAKTLVSTKEIAIGE